MMLLSFLLCCLSYNNTPSRPQHCSKKRSTVCLSYLSKRMLLGVVVRAVLPESDWVTYRLNVHPFGSSQIQEVFCGNVED